MLQVRWQLRIIAVKLTIIFQIMAWHLDGDKPLSKPMLHIVNWTLRNKFQWNHYQTFHLKNALENIICVMGSILAQPPCVNVSASRCLSLQVCQQWSYVSFALNHHWYHHLRISSTLVQIVWHYLNQCWPSSGMFRWVQLILLIIFKA